MAIVLSYSGTSLSIDVGDDFELLESDQLRTILLAFDVEERVPGRVILTVPQNGLVEAIDYVQSTFHSLGLDVNLGVGVDIAISSHQRQTELIARARTATTGNELLLEPELEPSLGMARPLLSHQVRGLSRALSLNHFAEFSVQGSGKTTIALAAFAAWRNQGEVEKLMVIGPLSSMRPWEEELQQIGFGDQFESMRWSGSQAKRTTYTAAFQSSDVILCTYDTASRDKEMLAGLLDLYPTMLVLDESHYIKRFGSSARGDAALFLAQSATKRWIMTGTPAPYDLQDLWTQFRFLWPSGPDSPLGTIQQFTQLISSPKENQIKETRLRLEPFFHRTTQSELGLREAEPNTVQIHDTDISPEQRRIIELLEIRVAAEARRQLPEIRDRETLDAWRRVRIIRLLQASSNPGLLLKAVPKQNLTVTDVQLDDLVTAASVFALKQKIPAKIEWTVNKVRELVGEGRKVVVWTGWVENLHYISELLSDLNPLMIYGGIRPFSRDEDDEEEQSRENNIRQFKERSDRPILIANPAACAESISLHKECHDAIYVDRNFNCGQFMQSLNRIHRVGLPKEATTRYWLPFIECAVEKSVDSKLLERQNTMYEFLGDETVAMGIDWQDTVEDDITDSPGEVGEAFNDIMERINAPTNS